MPKPKFELGDEITVYPNILPGKKLKVQPGDMTFAIPNGNGVYGYQKKNHSNPILNAPQQEPCGGVVYFDNNITKDDFMALARVMGIISEHDNENYLKYAAFVVESEEPAKDGFLARMRLVSDFGLRYIFKALDEYDYNKFEKQKLTVAEAYWQFIKCEKERWGTSMWQPDRGLAGTFGGDGHYACEELAFGIMSENNYHRISSIWSRAWLVTK